MSEKLPLVRFGDSWIRLSSDGKIFIGIPLQQNYTSFEKKIKNVRMFVSGELVSQEIQGKFSTWDLSSSNRVAFDEFLMPGTNFVVVWTADFLQLIQNTQRKYNIFILYETFDEKGNPHSLQFQARKLNLNGAFLTDTHLQLSTGTQQDLLSIVSTTKCWNFSLIFEEENALKDIFEVLEELNFNKYEVENFYASQEYEQKDQIHFSNQLTSSLWFGVLVSITRKNELKIYSDLESKVLALIRTLEEKSRSRITVARLELTGNKIENKFETCYQNECELVNLFKDKIRSQPSTSRGNGIVKVSVKELQKFTDLQLASDLEYRQV